MPPIAVSPDAKSRATADFAQAALCDLEDPVLMARLQEGDVDALEVLYDRYCNVILRIGSRLLRDETEAEDLLQEVFLYVFRKNCVFDISKGCVGSWLIQITYARALNRRKWLKRRFFEQRQNHEDTVPFEPAASGLNPEELAELSCWRTHFLRAFECLTQRQRETIHLYVFEGYSLLEISKKFGASLPNVRNFYYRGLEQLRNRLSADGFPIRRDV
jgi:RNA polymerase sigma-70 factor (ECF subfamily)